MAEENKYAGTPAFNQGGPDTPVGASAEYLQEQLDRAEEEGQFETVEDRQTRLEQKSAEREEAHQEEQDAHEEQ